MVSVFAFDTDRHCLFFCVGNATASDQITRTITPDQMNMEALLQSHDYFAASTGFSDTAGNEALQSTYSVPETGTSQFETGFNFRNDTESGQMLATGGGASTEDELRTMFNIPRKVITIPTIDQFDNGGSGTDDELSELSMGL